MSEERTLVEISGIPLNIPSNQVEYEVIKIYKVGNFTIHGKSLDHLDIHAVHRKGKKELLS